MEKKNLGKSKIQISPMGMGCWAIGGKWSTPDGKPLGWGDVDDNESVKAIHAGLSAGINFIDTANVYGAGHSEKVIARALKGRRDQVVLATKFGGNIDEEKKIALEQSGKPESIRKSCDDSLRRLGTDYIDLFQFHIGGYELAKAQEVRDVLEELVKSGKIRSYGWSTDDEERARFFALGEHCTAVQFQANVISQNAKMVKVCEDTGITGINRGPLAMGLLSGKYLPGAKVGSGDIRGAGMEWMKFFNADGSPNAEFLKNLEKVRDILTAGGRSLVQGALGWLWACSPALVPIPGFRTVKQIEENARSMDFGPLSLKQFTEIQRLLGLGKG